jgi:hypothetical protein
VDGNPVGNADADGLLVTFSLNAFTRAPSRIPNQDAVRINNFASGVTLNAVTTVSLGQLFGAVGMEAVPGACRLAPKVAEKLKEPCKNAVLAAALGSGICNGDPADDFVQDMARRDAIRKGTELIKQRKIGNQRQYP